MSNERISRYNCRHAAVSRGLHEIIDLGVVMEKLPEAVKDDALLFAALCIYVRQRKWTDKDTEIAGRVTDAMRHAGGSEVQQKHQLFAMWTLMVEFLKDLDSIRIKEAGEL